MADGRPQPPNFVLGINMIWRMFLDGCDAPLTVWIETMWPPLLKLIIAWYTFDLFNLIASYFRPGGLSLTNRNKRHGRGGDKGQRKSLKRLPGRIISFDLGEYVGQNLPGAEELRHRDVPPGARFLWTIFGVIEHFNYYLMVLSLGGDFIYEWASSVVRLGYCGNQDDAILLAHKGGDEQIGIVGWWPIIWSETLKNRKLAFWNGIGVVELNGPGVMYLAMTCICFETGGGDGSVYIRLNCLDGERRGLTYVASATIPEGARIDLRTDGEILNGELWIAEIMVHGHWFFEDMEFFMQAPWQPYI